MKAYRFTFAQGLAVQTEQLSRWKRVLTKSAHSKLAAYLAAKNAELDPETATGFDVTRGDSMDDWLHNDLMQD